VSALTCIIVIGFCLMIQAFFTASEMSLVSSNRLRIRHLADSGNRKAKLIQELLEIPERFLSTTMVGVNVVLVLASTMASYLMSSEKLLNLGRWGPLAATVIMLPLILIFGEIVPKTLVRPRATQVSMMLGYPLRFAYYLLYPLVQVVSWLSARLVGLLRIKSGDQRMFTSVEDIRLLMKEGEKQGALTKEEQKMISRIFDFGENEVSDIMIPLIDVALAAETSQVGDLWEIINRTGYTRIPIFRERVDKIIGTVQATDLLTAAKDDEIKTYVRPPYIVPESKPLEELLEELRATDVNMAIVVDEYGGVAGIVTLENVIEEIVGEIHDEYDMKEVAEFKIRGEVADISGRMRIDELNEVLNLNLPEEEEEETIAGFIIDLLGSIPQPGEKISYNEHTYTVTEATDRRIVRIEISGPAVREKSRQENLNK